MRYQPDALGLSLCAFMYGLTLIGGRIGPSEARGGTCGEAAAKTVKPLELGPRGNEMATCILVRTLR